MSERSDEWQEGNAAHYEGYMDSDNPYPIGSDQAMDWEDGRAAAENNGA